MQTQTLKTEYKNYQIIKSDYEKKLRYLVNNKASFSSSDVFKAEYKKLLLEKKKVLKNIKENNKKYKKELKKYLFLKNINQLIDYKKKRQDLKNEIKSIKSLYKNCKSTKAEKAELKKECKEKIRNLKLEFKNFNNYQRPNLFKQLFVLVKLNLSNHINLKQFKYFGINFIIFYLIAIGIFTYLSMTFFNLFKITTLLNISYNRPFIRVIVFIFIIFSIISAGITLLNNLYLDKNDNIISHLPISKKTIYYSKIISALIIELKKSFIIYFPLLLGYGLSYKIVDVSYVFKNILVSILIPMFSILLGQIVAIILLFLRYVINKYLFLNIFIAAIIVLLSVSVINSSLKFMTDKEGEITMLQLFLSLHNLFTTGFTNILKASFIGDLSIKFLFSKHLAINSLEVFILILDYLIILFLITSLTSYFYYFFKNITHLSNNFKKVKSKKSKRYYPIVITYFIKEIKDVVREPKILSQNLFYALIMPITFYALNRFFSSFTLTNTGRDILLFAELLVGLIILTTNNILSASIISREGDSIYFLKTNPQSVVKHIWVKLFLIYINTIFVIIISLILNISYGSNIGSSGDDFEIILMHVIFLLVAIIHAIWSAESDIISPDNIDYKQTGLLDNNKNVLISIKKGIFMSVSILAIFLIIKAVTSIFIAMIIMLVILLVLLVVKVFTINLKTSVYLRWK